MKFREKLGKKSRVLTWDRKHPKAAQMLRGADIRPSNLALATRASFLPSPEEGPSTLVKGFDDPHRKKANAHSMGEKRRKDRVN
jgi:hypothetical protein